MYRTFFIFLITALMGLPVQALRADDTAQLAELKQALAQLRHDYETRITALEQRLAEAEAGAQLSPPPVAVSASPDSAGNLRAFNPAMGIVLTGKAQSFSRSGDDIPGFAVGSEAGRGAEGLSLSEAEMSLSANVDDKFYGMFTGTFVSDNGNDAVEIEQAYLQTTALPGGATLKFGRDFSAIGYLNEFHTHADDFADRPLPYRAFLNGQYKDDGVQLRWLAPLDRYVELGAELWRGAQFPAGGAAHSGAGAWSLFARTGGDVGFSNSWQAGVGYLHAKSIGRETEAGDLFTGNSDLFSAHLVWKWAPDGTPTVHNFKAQCEAFWRNETGTFTAAGGTPSRYDQQQTGWYGQAVYQFRPQWRTALRYAALAADDPGAAFTGTTLDTLGHDPSMWSVMVDWSNSEFSRIRLQYNLDNSRPASDQQWILQYIHSLGAHGAHQF